MPKDGCVPNDEWECPGTWKKPEYGPKGIDAASSTGKCSEHFTPCTDTHCCTANAFRCLEKKNKFFAQCLRPETCTVSPQTPSCKDVTGQPVEALEPLPAAAAAAPAVAQAQVPMAAPSVAAAPQEESSGGIGVGTLIFLFVLAVSIGAVGILWYKFYYVPKPPTVPPRAESASEIAPAPPEKEGKVKAKVDKKVDKKKASKEEKASIIADGDEDMEEPDEEIAKPSPKPESKSKPPARKASMQDLDDEMDL